MKIFRKSSRITYRLGTTSSVISVAKRMPKPRDIAIGIRNFACIEVSKIIGAKPMNVIFILADDLGFSDLGCYGGEIETPHLDSLAENGLRFTHFYNTARCWPTRP